MTLAFGVFALAYIVLQGYTLIRWSGVWRIAALVPLLLMIAAYPFLAASVNDIHNQMGPFAWFLFAYVEAAIGSGYLILLMILRGLLMGLQRASGRESALSPAAQASPPIPNQEGTKP